MKFNIQVETGAGAHEHASRGVDLVIGFNAVDGDCDIGRSRVVRMNHEHVSFPLDVDASAWIFPCQRLSVMEFPEPLLANHLDIESFGVVIDGPNSCV